VRGRRGRRQRGLPNYSIHVPEGRHQRRGLATSTRRSSRPPCNRRTLGPAAAGGISRRNTRSTGLPSTESKWIGRYRRVNMPEGLQEPMSE
jgi:hypothetical protein